MMVRIGGKLVQGMTIDQHQPSIRLLHTAQKVQQGGLAAAAFALDDDAGTGGYLEIDVREQRPIAIAQLDITQGQALMNRRQRLLAAPILDGQTQQIPQTLVRGHETLILGPVAQPPPQGGQGPH